MAHELPPLPFDYAALEPVIDAATMKLHHDMHHAAYVKNLNAALEKHPELQTKSAEDLIRDLNAVPEDIRSAVRNNGGGHVNHSMFWKIMKPKGGGNPAARWPTPSRKLSAASKISRPNLTMPASSSSVRDGLGWLENRVVICKLPVPPTRTTLFLRDCFRFWATTSGSMPTI